RQLTHGLQLLGAFSRRLVLLALGHVEGCAVELNDVAACVAHDLAFRQQPTRFAAGKHHTKQLVRVSAGLASGVYAALDDRPIVGMHNRHEVLERHGLSFERPFEEATQVCVLFYGVAAHAPPPLTDTPRLYRALEFQTQLLARAWVMLTHTDFISRTCNQRRLNRASRQVPCSNVDVSCGRA